MSTKQEVKSLIEVINKLKSNNQFKNYIEYIRFPLYKNLEINSKIDFDFPFTVFTGQNGSGKSSALHAMYGAPDGYSTGSYWFSTKVDPIEEGEGNTNCFIYSYLNDEKKSLEVLKTRIQKKKNPDYWEPSRPLKKYNMEILDGARNPAVKKKVIYLDFRSELSAFDKYFYFTKFRSSVTLKSKQDVIRKYSKHLRNIIDTSSRIVIRGKKRNNAAKILSKEETLIISKILGKAYSECKIIDHDLFSPDNSGLSVYFKTDKLKYSEAFAGRGEFAVVKLVHEVINATDNSLVILDEPEVSLHPKAQEELKKFLLEQIKVKKLQVIVSTHSPTFVSDLPDEAIKLFYESADKKVAIKNSCNYIEAFQHIGAEIKESGKAIIIVEDSIAKAIVDGILDDLGGEYPLIFDVKFFPGGAEEILKKAANYSEEKESHKFLLLDGDHTREKIKVEKFTVEEIDNLDFLKKAVNDATNITFEKLGFRINGNNTGANQKDKVNAAVSYLHYLENNLFYLPEQIPEDLLWDAAYIKGMLQANKAKEINFTGDSKKKIHSYIMHLYGEVSHNTMPSTIKLLVKNFIKNKSENYKSIVKLLNEMKAIHMKK